MNDSVTREKYSYGYALDLQKPFKEKEKEFEIDLSKYQYCIIRFDGKDMTSAFKIKHKAINDKFFQTIKIAFYNFVNKYPKIMFAYSFSDEISILFKPSKSVDIDYSRGEKVLSLFSAQLALEFKKAIAKTKLDDFRKDWIFDARIIGCNKEEVIKYFKSRQAFAIDKYLTQLKGELGINYKLHTSTDIINALKEKHVVYEDLDCEYKYGLVYSSKNKGIKSFNFDDDVNALGKLCF